MESVSSRDTFNAYWIFCHVESVFARDTFNAYWIFCHVESVFSRDTFNINPIFWNCRRCLFKRHLYLKFNSFMILKIVEGVSSKDTFHVAKTVVNLSIFSQLPFFNYNFLKLPQKLKKPVEVGLRPRPKLAYEKVRACLGIFLFKKKKLFLNNRSILFK